MNRNVFVAVLVAWLALASLPTDAASAPEVINHQGVLRDASGLPLDGTFDVIFRLFDSPSGGVALYTDAHLAGGTGAVVVINGLFSVGIGLGDHGSQSLAEVFTDNTALWVEVEIGGEILSPRMEIRSVGHALNAGNAGLIDGLGASSLLRSDQDSSSSGAITAQDLRSRGDLFANVDGPDGDSFLYFYDGTQTERYLKWNDLFGRFETSSRLYAPALEAPTIDGTEVRVYGDIYFNRNGPNRDGNIYFHEDGSNTAQWLRWYDFGRYFELSSDIIVYGRVQADRSVQTKNDIYVNFTGPDADGNIYFHDDGSNTAQWFRWNDFGGYFEISRDILAHGIVQADSTVRAGGQVILKGPQIEINEDGPNGNQDIEFYNGAPEAERFQWDATSLRFEVSDDFHAFGDLSASGAKPFVQNHPYRDDLEIVYTALEGNEVTTFTRGSGRLLGGEVRIELEESFRHVTNPELGLSAHVTPRGEWTELYVASLDTRELVVRSDRSADAAFDFVVYGLRIGYEDYPVYRAKRAESFAPPLGHFAEEFAEEPALAEHTALSRYRRMSASTFGRSVDEMPTALALREAIGMREPDLDFPRGSEIPEREMNRLALDAESRSREVGSSAAARSAPEAPATAAGADHADPGGTGAPRVGRPFDEHGDVYARSFRPSAGDIARLVPVSEPVEAGDVLVIDPRVPGNAMLARFEEDATVFGIVSGEPGLVLGAQGPGDAEQGDLEVPIALGGVVPCKVDASWGAIRPGDLLQTSPTPGHAMRADDPRTGSVLGKALEPLDAGTGLIRVLVTVR